MYRIMLLCQGLHSRLRFGKFSFETARFRGQRIVLIRDRSLKVFNRHFLWRLAQLGLGCSLLLGLGQFKGGSLVSR